jgi:hypothetical protein
MGPVKLRRALSMGFAEVSCRSRQELFKWLDRRVDPRRRAFNTIGQEMIDRWRDEHPLVEPHEQMTTPSHHQSYSIT